MPKAIDTPEYWIESFALKRRELDHIYEHVLEAGRPFGLRDLAAEVVRFHVAHVTLAYRDKASSDGLIYRPMDRYEVGQKVVFPALDGAAGVVESIRPGNNAEYGTYEVIRTKLGNTWREFAANLQYEHALSQALADADPEEAATAYADIVAPKLTTALRGDSDWVTFGNCWILKELLPPINAGHVNLAEAILMLGAEPMPAEQILPELELDDKVPLATRAMALDVALSRDDRFRNVGAVESAIWALASQA